MGSIDSYIKKRCNKNLGFDQYTALKVVNDVSLFDAFSAHNAAFCSHVTLTGNSTDGMPVAC